MRMSLPLRLDGPSKLATDPLRDKADWPLIARFDEYRPPLPAGRMAKQFATCDGLHDLSHLYRSDDGLIDLQLRMHRAGPNEQLTCYPLDE